MKVFVIGDIVKHPGFGVGEVKKIDINTGLVFVKFETCGMWVDTVNLELES